MEHFHSSFLISLVFISEVISDESDNEPFAFDEDFYKETGSELPFLQMKKAEVASSGIYYGDNSQMKSAINASTELLTSFKNQSALIDRFGNQSDLTADENSINRTYSKFENRIQIKTKPDYSFNQFSGGLTRQQNNVNNVRNETSRVHRSNDSKGESRRCSNVNNSDKSFPSNFKRPYCDTIASSSSSQFNDSRSKNQKSSNHLVYVSSTNSDATFSSPETSWSSLGNRLLSNFDGEEGGSFSFRSSESDSFSHRKPTTGIVSTIHGSNGNHESNSFSSMNSTVRNVSAMQNYLYGVHGSKMKIGQQQKRGKVQVPVYNVPTFHSDSESEDDEDLPRVFHRKVNDSPLVKTSKQQDMLLNDGAVISKMSTPSLFTSDSFPSAEPSRKQHQQWKHRAAIPRKSPIPSKGNPTSRSTSIGQNLVDPPTTQLKYTTAPKYDALIATLQESYRSKPRISNTNPNATPIVTSTSCFDSDAPSIESIQQKVDSSASLENVNFNRTPNSTGLVHTRASPRCFVDSQDNAFRRGNDNLSFTKSPTLTVLRDANVSVNTIACSIEGLQENTTGDSKGNKNGFMRIPTSSNLETNISKKFQASLCSIEFSTGKSVDDSQRNDNGSNQTAEASAHKIATLNDVTTPSAANIPKTSRFLPRMEARVSENDDNHLLIDERISDRTSVEISDDAVVPPLPWQNCIFTDSVNNDDYDFVEFDIKPKKRSVFLKY